jgi:predicted DCC family thiol-disulfide oxidoreductase YuxK
MSENASSRAHPIIFFDGVCNLCNASVVWLLQHDRRARFRFASLQSDAARRLLAEHARAAADPDSVLLLDGDGLHVRSDAALRIAAQLGLPWSLAGVAWVLPRAVRDALYRWIAANRYRWFGRRDACLMPRPEWASRFLDAGEPVRSSPAGFEQPPAAAASAVEWPTRFGRYLQRFAICYLFLHISCFPIGDIPGTEGLASRYEALRYAAIPWVARHVFGLEITVFPNGSGDTTYNYVEVFTYVVLAIVAALLWTLAARGRPLALRTRDLFRVYVRYYLATVLLSYGWHKLVPLQFPAPGPDRLLIPYGESSPMGLLWTFMGASTPYQMFGGLAEVVAGLLLLWRRTALLGALAAAGVMLNVVMFNFCYDVPVKLFSSHLLLMALFLIAPDAMRLAGVAVLNLPVQPAELRPFPVRAVWLRRGLLALKLAFVALIAVWPAWQSVQMWRADRVALGSPLHGLYRVESFTRDGASDRALPDEQRWVRVGINAIGIAAIQRADGGARRYGLEIDEEGATLTIRPRGEAQPSELRFRTIEGGLLELEGPFEGGPIRACLRRDTDPDSLLTSRGFHWINEFPFNR